MAKTTLTSRARSAALIALDQMDGGGMEAATVAPLLTSNDLILKRTATWIVSHHSDWGPALTGYFRERLSQRELGPEESAELERLLAQFSVNKDVQELIVEVLREPSFPAVARLTTMRAMGRTSLKQVPSSWAGAVVAVLLAGDGPMVAAAVNSARSMTFPKECSAALVAQLHKVALDPERPDQVRLDALAAVPGGLNPVDPTTFDFLRARLASSEPVMIRSAAAGVLARARLSSEQLQALAETIKNAGPMEVPRLLSAFDHSTDEAVGLKLVASLKDSPGLSSLRPDMLKAHLTNFPDRVQVEGAALAVSLNADAAKQQAHLNELAGTLKGGDIRRGQLVFNSQKAACSTCHAIGYLGGNVGPDLTKIGQVRTERDLLESIVYPSASFVRSFEPVLITTKSGDDYNGVVRKDTPDEIVLATGPGAEVRVARAEITDMRPGTVSVMPAGLDEQLSRQELADLVAFLRATRW
jgi:putative heme-binding domain-containing protein